MTAPTAFFRSLSLAEDLSHPERFEHYRPTSRAVPIVAAVCRPAAATMVIAPYGSGKSLAAGVGALFVRDDPSDRGRLADLAARLADVDPALSDGLRARVEAGSRGGVVVLSGQVADPLTRIAEAVGMARAPKTVEGFGKAMRDLGWDHVAIVWDEFGRHLEGLVADGRSAELDVVQRLAERASRAEGPTLSLTLLLHQNLLSYATRLNETSRTEWRKIEGRFAALRLVEDSREFFELVAEVVSSLRGAAAPPADLAEVAAAAVRCGWFDGMADAARVERVLRGAWPVSAGALQVLPTLVARVGQNERSLFSFLRERDLSKPVGVEEVYVAFSDAMRTDVGIGGTYRRWLETESARSRADTAPERALLAAACLLQLGGSGERRRVPREGLELAARTSDADAGEVAAAFDELVAARLLLWRRHNDDVAVWHGADVDVALRVREERERHGAAFDLRRFLEERFPAPHVRAPGHNAAFGVNRYLEGRYVERSGLRSPRLLPAASSGVVEYLLAEDASAIAEGHGAAASLAGERLVLVVPDRPLDIRGAALELVAIEALRRDRDFLASDPMVATEIDELHSVAFEQLARLMRSLLDPSGAHATWHGGGVALDVSPERPASVTASRLLTDWYPKTPRIANEQLMRPAASRTMQTARVRVVSAILERSDRPDFGYADHDGSAEASIYRTVVERTGLRDAARARFRDPDEIADPGLAEVWARIAEFFRIPTDEDGAGRYRPLSALVERLQAPPVGLPRAVMPVLVAAGFRHFARAVALYRDGIYVPDLLGFPFDAMVAAPEAYHVRVLRLTPALVEYLSEVCYAFTHERPRVADELVRRAHDAITGWLLTVPDGSRRSARLGQSARALLRAVGNSGDPVDLLIRDLPAAFGTAELGSRLVGRIETARMQIDHLRDEYADEAVEVIRQAFARHGAGPSAVDAMKAWASCFDVEELDRAASLRIVDRAVLRKALETANGRFSEKSLANSLSSILLQRSLDKWDDRTAAQFCTALREARERVEAAALETARPRAALRPIIEARLADLNDMLARIGEVPDSSEGGVRAAGGGR